MMKPILLSLLGGALLAGAALAQTPPPTTPLPGDLAGTSAQSAIINGKHLQPHLLPGEKESDPDGAARLLQQGAHDDAADSPITVPRDIYGNPIGGNPGLNPPGLTPPSQKSH